MLEIKNVSKDFVNSKDLLFGAAGTVRAVHNVTLSIAHNETLGIVGESGSGKTTLGRVVLRLIEPTEGNIVFDGVNILALPPSKLRGFRKRMQIIFQDSSLTFDPRWTIGKTLRECLNTHIPSLGVKAGIERTVFLLETVGLSADYMNKYPNELSGGQRQRVGIAKAISVEPEFIVADEPVSALDVSVQAQILNLLTELKKSRKLSYMFISHDLSVIKFMSDRICVMYMGHIVEIASTDIFFSNPLHPYSNILLDAIPTLEAGKHIKTNEPFQQKNISVIENSCPFCSRCAKAIDICRVHPPELREIGNGHMIACHNVSK